MRRGPEDYSHRLFLTRDIENMPNFEGLEVVRQIDEQLENLPTYVGIRYWGSETKGYSTEGSDIDTLLLYDNSQTDGDDAYIPEEPLLKRATELQKELSEKNGRPVIIKEVPISIESIKDLLGNNDYQSAGTQIARLSGLVKGKKVKGYRNNVREIISELNDERRKLLIDSTVERLIREDGYRSDKWQERTGFTDGQIEGILKEREQLHRKRLEKLYCGHNTSDTQIRE